MRCGRQERGERQEPGTQALLGPTRPRATPQRAGGGRGWAKLAGARRLPGSRLLPASSRRGPSPGEPRRAGSGRATSAAGGRGRGRGGARGDGRDPSARLRPAPRGRCHRTAQAPTPSRVHPAPNGRGCARGHGQRMRSRASHLAKGAWPGEAPRDDPHLRARGRRGSGLRPRGGGGSRSGLPRRRALPAGAVPGEPPPRRRGCAARPGGPGVRGLRCPSAEAGL